MAFAMLPTLFKLILKNLQKIKIRNINIRVPLRLSITFVLLYFIKIIYLNRMVNKWPSQGFQAFEINHLGAQMTNVNIWVPLSFTQILFYFSQVVDKWPLQPFLAFLHEF